MTLIERLLKNAQDCQQRAFYFYTATHRNSHLAVADHWARKAALYYYQIDWHKQHGSIDILGGFDYANQKLWAEVDSL